MTSEQARDSRVSREWFGAGALALAVLSAVLRLWQLGDAPLTLDEATFMEMARGVLSQGYPHLQRATESVPLTTYELIPYPIALSIAIFGATEFAVRLPAVVFGTLTTFALTALGKRWFSPTVGLVSGALYALSPWAIYWGTNAFHPSQAQFFAFLTIVVAYEFLRTDSVGPKLAAAVVSSFGLMYLSWEGTGFLLATFGVLTLLRLRRSWEWIRSPWVWAAGSGIGSLIVIQATRRIVIHEPYLRLGSGKADLQPLLAPVFGNPSFDLTYHARTLFGIEAQIALGLIFLFAVVFWRTHERFRYLAAIVLITLAWMTAFLGYYNPQYTYFLQAPLILAAGAAAVEFCRFAQRHAKAVPTVLANAIGVALPVQLTVLLALSSTVAGVQASRLFPEIPPSRTDRRPGLLGVDYRAPGRLLAAMATADDLVVTTAPLPLKYYSGVEPDYYLQTILHRKIGFDPGSGLPMYRDKYLGSPVLRSRNEFEQLLSAARVWVVLAPLGVSDKLIERELLLWFEKNTKLVAEGADYRVLVWPK